MLIGVDRYRCLVRRFFLDENQKKADRYFLILFCVGYHM